MKKTLASIVVLRKGNVPLQAQLAARLRRLIQQGDLSSGERVPPSRELAADLNISRNTVTLAFDRLVDEGYLESRSRSGLFVCASISSGAGSSGRGRVIPERSPQPIGIRRSPAFTASTPKAA